MKFKLNDFKLNINFFKKKREKANSYEEKPKIVKEKFYKSRVFQRKAALCLGVVGIVGFIGTYTAIYNNRLKEAEINYNEQLTNMQLQLDVLGSVKQVYFLATDKEAGEAISKSDFAEMSIPSVAMSKEYISIDSEIPKAFYKVDVKSGTPLTKSILMADPITQQDRYIDIVASVYPIEMKVGDYVDILLTTPTGGTYRLMSKKRIAKVRDNSVEIMGGDIDIHTYESAITDLSLNPGMKMHCVTYVEPGLQNAPLSFYPVNIKAINSMEMNPSIKEIPEKELILKRRRIFEKSCEVSEKEQVLLVSTRNSLLERLQADLVTYRASLLQSEVPEAEADKTQQDGETDEVTEDGKTVENGVEIETGSSEEVTTEPPMPTT